MNLNNNNNNNNNNDNDDDNSIKKFYSATFHKMIKCALHHLMITLNGIGKELEEWNGKELFNRATSRHIASLTPSVPA